PASSGITGNDHCAAERERCEHIARQLPADAVHHDIDAFAFGDAQNAVLEALPREVDDVLVSGRASAFGLLCATCSGDCWRGAKAASDLHSFHADGTADGRRQHGLSSLELREFRQRQIARQISSACEIRWSVIIIDVMGNRRYTGGRYSNELAPRAIGRKTEAWSPDKYSITDPEIVALRFSDNTHSGLTADARQVLRRRHVDVARAKRVVERIDADRAHRDEHFAVFERGLRKINETVLAVVTKGLILNRFHGLAPTGWCRRSGCLQYGSSLTGGVAGKFGNDPLIGGREGRGSIRGDDSPAGRGRRGKSLRREPPAARSPGNGQPSDRGARRAFACPAAAPGKSQSGFD